MSKHTHILGIDPDLTKSGIAILNIAERRFEAVQAMPFADVIKMLDTLGSGDRPCDLLVVIEDSSNSTNWHLGGVLKSGLPLMRKLSTAAAIGRSAGQCHATLTHLKEYAESVGLEVKMQKPLRKCWKGADRKLSQAEAEQFMVGLPKRCNQECRDSALLCWVVAGLPIRVKV